MFPSLSTRLGGSFVFLNVGAPILFLVFPFFGCLGLFMVGRVFFFLLNSINDMSFSLEDIHVTGNGDVESAKGPKCRQYKSIAKFLFFTGCPQTDSCSKKDGWCAWVGCNAAKTYLGVCLCTHLLSV